MEHKEFLEWLEANEACPPAIAWVSKNGYSMEESYNNCEHTCWLAWLVMRIKPFDHNWIPDLSSKTSWRIEEIAGYEIDNESYMQPETFRSLIPYSLLPIPQLEKTKQ